MSTRASASAILIHWRSYRTPISPSMFLAEGLRVPSDMQNPQANERHAKCHPTRILANAWVHYLAGPIPVSPGGAMARHNNIISAPSQIPQNPHFNLVWLRPAYNYYKVALHCLAAFSSLSHISDTVALQPLLLSQSRLSRIFAGPTDSTTSQPRRSVGNNSLLKSC